MCCSAVDIAVGRSGTAAREANGCRLTYIYKANQRFYKMLAAWEAGDIETVGSIFREDGIGLRDEYVFTHLHPDCQQLLWSRAYARFCIH